MNMHLIRDERFDQEAPPQLYFKFSALELNDCMKPYFLSGKGSMSKAFIVDTLHNQVLSVALASTVIKVSNDTSYFVGHINIDEHARYFGLDSSYFNRLDFSSEKEFLREKCKNMLNRSILLYIQQPANNFEDNKEAMLKNSCSNSWVIVKPVYSIDDIKIY